MTTDIAIT